MKALVHLALGFVLVAFGGLLWSMAFADGSVVGLLCGAFCILIGTMGARA